MNKFQIVKRFLSSASVAALMLSAGCSAKVDNHGYNNEDDWKKEVIVGQTTKDEVLGRLGSPSSQSSFGPETWYYISSRQEEVAFFKPEITDQNVFRIEFDSSGVVSKLESYNEADSKNFNVATRTTPTEGHTLGFIEQVLGNIGRFNAPGTTASGSGIAPGRNPNGHY